MPSPEEVTEREFDMNMAKLGIQAENFKHSALGRYMRDRADVEIEQATAELIDADSEDIKLNREIRNKIKVAHTVTEWIEEAIGSGQVALANIEAEEAAEEN